MSKKKESYGADYEHFCTNRVVYLSVSDDVASPTTELRRRATEVRQPMSKSERFRWNSLKTGPETR